MRTVCLQFCARQRDGEALCLCNCRDCHLQLEGKEIRQAMFNLNVMRRTMQGQNEAAVAVVVEIEMLRLDSQGDSFCPFILPHAARFIDAVSISTSSVVSSPHPKR